MRQTFFFLVLFTISLSSYSQLSLGLFGGISNYQGDLVEKAYVGRFMKPAFGVTVGYEITDRIGIRGGLTFAKVAGDDRYSSKDYLRARNLNFESNIAELSVVGVFNTLPEKRLSPYLFGGFAIYRFNPYTTISGSDQKIFLQPLSTEGQGLPGYDNKSYSLTQLALPFGGGLKFAVNENIRVGLEVGIRKLFTDYLDDVSTNYADPNDLLRERGQLAVDLSYRGDEVPAGDPIYPAKGDQRGGSKFKDWYYLTGLHVAFRIGGGYGGGGAFKSGRKGYGCPTGF